MSIIEKYPVLIGLVHLELENLSIFSKSTAPLFFWINFCVQYYTPVPLWSILNIFFSSWICLHQSDHPLWRSFHLSFILWRNWTPILWPWKSWPLCVIDNLRTTCTNYLPTVLTLTCHQRWRWVSVPFLPWGITTLALVFPSCPSMLYSRV